MADAAAVLLARHERLSARADAAARVLRLVDDPDAEAQDLARAMGADPVLAARVLRVANSPYYGLSGKVSTLPFAVSVLGFQTVRTLAVTAAAGLGDPSAVPEGFWQVAATCATAAETLAPQLGADPGDAFSVGLLHTLGAALLHQHEPLGLLCLPEPEDPLERAELEHDRYGITHDQAGARVLEAWHVPSRITVLIARHHEALLPDAPALERALRAARLLTDARLRGPVTQSTEHELTWVTEGAVPPQDLSWLLDQVGERAEGLLEGLEPRRH